MDTEPVFIEADAIYRRVLVALYHTTYRSHAPTTGQWVGRMAIHGTVELERYGSLVQPGWRC